MKTEEWLSRARGIDREIQWLKREYEKAFLAATSMTASIFGDKVQTTPGNRSEDKMTQTSDYALEIKTQLEEKESIKKEVVAAIDRVGNVEQRLLLRIYYLDGKTWEQVAEEIEKSSGYVKGPLRRAAIEKVHRIRKKYNF